MTPPQEQPRPVEGKCRQFGTSGPCFDCISITGCGFNTPCPVYRVKWEGHWCPTCGKPSPDGDDCLTCARWWRDNCPACSALAKLTALLPDIDAFLGESHD